MLQADHLTWAPRSASVSITTCADQKDAFSSPIPAPAQGVGTRREKWERDQSFWNGPQSERWCECSRRFWLLSTACPLWRACGGPWCRAFLYFIHFIHFVVIGRANFTDCTVGVVNASNQSLKAFTLFSDVDFLPAVSGLVDVPHAEIAESARVLLSFLARRNFLLIGRAARVRSWKQQKSFLI